MMSDTSMHLMFLRDANRKRSQYGQRGGSDRQLDCCVDVFLLRYGCS